MLASRIRRRSVSKITGVAVIIMRIAATVLLLLRLLWLLLMMMLVVMAPIAALATVSPMHRRTTLTDR